ncbi:MAG: hypothetical protein WAW80_02920 [Candidatus Saccharimonadales bacterium]
MSEIIPTTEQSLESKPLHSAFILFETEYGDPDKPVIDTHKGQLVQYATLHFHDQIDSRTVILRSGIHKDPQTNKTEQLFWMASFDHTTNEPTFYEIVDSEKQIIHPLIQRTGGYEIIHTAKTRNDEGTTVQFRMGSHALEWLQ